MALDHLPEAPGVRIGGDTLEDDLRAAGGQRPIDHVAVACHPADVGRAPEHVLGLQVEAPLHGHPGPQQVAAGAVLHALGLAGGAAGVEDEQRVLGAHGRGRAFGALALHGLLEGLVAAFHHVAGGGGALEDEDVLHAFATAQRQPVVHDGLERQLLAAAHLVVGGDHGHGLRVHDALLHRLGGKAPEHHAVRGADARAGLHGHQPFHAHGHVDQHAVALVHAVGLQGVGELAHAREQLAVGVLGDLAVVGLEDHGRLVLHRRAHMAVQAVGAGVELAVLEPFVERRAGLIQHAREGLAPLQVLARLARPETFEVLVGLGAQRLIRLHAGDARALDDAAGRLDDAVFDQDGLDRRRGSTHGLSPARLTEREYFRRATVIRRTYTLLTQPASPPQPAGRGRGRSRRRPPGAFQGPSRTVFWPNQGHAGVSPREFAMLFEKRRPGQRPTILPGTTHSSNCAAVTWPQASAAWRSVVPSRCAFLAISAALS